MAKKSLNFRDCFVARTGQLSNFMSVDIEVITQTKEHYNSPKLIKISSFGEL